MDNQIQNTQPNGMGKYVLPTVVVALIVFTAIGFYLYQSQGIGSKQEQVGLQPAGETMMGNLKPQGIGMMERRQYRNGAYQVTGNYVSPGGPREVKVTLVLTEGLITGAETKATATDATSKRFQGEFVDNFKPMVIGKNIDEVVLTKVSGSSLTPKGFNDAVEKVKVEAAV